MVDTEMTATPTQQPDALRLADSLKMGTPYISGVSTIDQTEKELRRQHAEIERLTAENEALQAAVAEAVAAEREACEERVVSLFEVLETPYLPDITRAIRACDKA